MLQESQKASPTRSNSPFESEGQDNVNNANIAKAANERGQGNREAHSFSFNNNIYNNYNPEHSIEQVNATKRLLPKLDQQKIEMIQKLKRTGKIKSTGRSPVPLFLYEEANAKDHLYISQVTKHVPVAHDQQLQSDSSPRQAMNSSNRNSKGDHSESVASPRLAAYQELQTMLNMGYTITDNRESKLDRETARMHRSLDSFNKGTDGEPNHIPGEVNLQLPPGFNLKQPKLAEKNSSFMQPSITSRNAAYLQNAATDHNIQKHQASAMTAGTEGHFISNQTNTNNHHDDSLFQVESLEVSLADAQANQTILSPPATIQSKDDFYASQGFRSSVRKNTHKEINEMLRAAHPEIYEEQRRQKVQNHRREHFSNPKPKQLQDRKDSFASALRQNKWHAPVKKAQILQNILDQNKEPLNGEIDIAILAHHITKYGLEKDAGFEKNLSNRSGLAAKYGTSSLRKITIAKMYEMHRQKEADKKREQELNGVTSQLNVAGVMPKLEVTSAIIESGAEPDQGKSLVSTLMKGRNGSDTSKPSLPTAKVNMISGFLGMKRKLESGLRKDLTEGMLGKSNIDARSGSLNNASSRMVSPNGSDANSFLRNNMMLPNIGVQTASQYSQQVDGRLRPQLLAKRRAAQKLQANGRKQSLGLLGSLARSSGMSNASGGAGSGLQLHSSQASLEADPFENVDKIHEMLQQLKVMDNAGGKSRTTNKMAQTLPFNAAKTDRKQAKEKNLVTLGPSATSRPSFNIALASGTFDLTAQKEARILAATMAATPQYRTIGDTHVKKKLFAKKGTKKTLSKDERTLSLGRDSTEMPQTTFDLEKLYNPTFQLASQRKQQQPQTSRVSTSKLQQNINTQSDKSLGPEDLQKAELIQTFALNNQIIQQILQDTARMLQRPDSEAMTLRKNVIMPAQLGKYHLRRFVGKTIQLNVGQLYQPLKFSFNDYLNDFSVYFSTKERQPNEQNGYEQKETNSSKAIFPIAQEHLSANMLRYPKNKILYITLESTQDCGVSLFMVHNKKEAPDMTVASVYSSQADMSMQPGGSDTSILQRRSRMSLEASGEELDEKAQMTVQTLKTMLGGDEKTMHATKLNQMIKKKIQYMINEDLDVAKDFLDLVEILQSHKSQVNKALKENILKNQQSSGANEIFVQNSAEYVDPDSGVPLAGPIIDGFNNFFQNDLYSLYRQGHLSKAQLNAMRLEQTKQNKIEIDGQKRIKNLQTVTKREYRKELQDRIMEDLQKQAANRQFVNTWLRAVLVQKACANLKAQMDKKTEEARFLAQVFWIVMKMKIRSGTKLRRNGPTPEERLRRQIRGSMMSIGSTVHLRDVTAANIMIKFFKGIQMRKQIKENIIENAKWVRHIQEKFRSYWQVRTQQIDFIVRMVNREKERFQIAMIKETDKELRQIGWFVGKLTDDNIMKVVKAYYQACQFKYEPTFFAWRNQIAKFKEQGLEDMTGGWHNPFVMSRGIKNMQEINYKITYKKKSLKTYLETASSNTRARNKYYMNAPDISSVIDSAISQTNRSIGNMSLPSGDNNVSRAQAQLNSRQSKKRSQRNRSKMRKNNPGFATLEDAIRKQEAQFQAQVITDLKNCVYYPPRPAMKFFPTPVMLHQLIHQALMLQNKDLSAPESWKIQHDAVSSSHHTNDLLSRDNLTTKGSGFGVVDNERLNSQKKTDITSPKLRNSQNITINPIGGKQNLLNITGRINSSDGQIIEQPSRLQSRQQLQHDDDDEDVIIDQRVDTPPNDLLDVDKEQVINSDSSEGEEQKQEYRDEPAIDTRNIDEVSEINGEAAMLEIEQV